MPGAELDGQLLHYIHSCELDAPVQVKIGNLEGKFEKPAYSDLLQDPSLQHCVSLLRHDKNRTEEDQIRSPGDSYDMYVTCQVYCNNRKVGLPVQTCYKAFTTRWRWNEWLTLPIKFSELSRDAVLALTVYDFHDSTIPHCVGGTTISLFSKRGIFRRNIYDLKVWPFVEPDPVGRTTPGKLKQDPDDRNKQMPRLAKIRKKHINGHIPVIDWLDRLTFREIEQINEREKRNANMLYLMVEFPRLIMDGIDYHLIYFEPEGDKIVNWSSRPSIVPFPDPEMHFENLAEHKHHALMRTARISHADRELKPNAVNRDQLDVIIEYPGTVELSLEEKDKIWKFRYYLRSKKKALVKFLKCVRWSEPHERTEALEMIKSWSQMDVEDALELLSPQFSNPIVRKYAVFRLQHASREDLLLYLLQLVQALRYENQDDSGPLTSMSSLSSISSCDEAASIEPSSSPGQGSKISEGSAGATSDGEGEAGASYRASSLQPMELFDENSSMDLATFLIDTACKNEVFANYLYWYLRVEESTLTDGSDAKDDQIYSPEVFRIVTKRFHYALAKSGQPTRMCRARLKRQKDFVDRLVSITKAVSREKERKRKDYLRGQLSDHSVTTTSHQPESRAPAMVDFSKLNGLPLPLDPSVHVSSVVANKSTVFASIRAPLKITFKTTDQMEYSIIFKHGDDLRQDQLIIQIFSLMDSLLKKENLDLRLTVYQVLATSARDGFIQFVESRGIRELLTKQTIQEFLRGTHPNKNAPYGIAPEVMENYIRSCAGYSIMCYLLGIGDRHMDNILLCPDGRLFHIDFAYMLGNDPKVMAPPFKLTREMVDGMGGLSSNHFQEFRRYCYTAFLHLRRHAHLIVNLFALMVDSGIPDIASDPGKVVRKIQERFRMDLNDEQAVLFVHTLIETSLNAKIAVFIDWIHDVRWAGK